VEPVVSVHGLRKRYGRFEAVAGIDLEVRRGEIFAFLGPNGAGKTTTVEILEGFRRRTDGEVSVLGVDPAKGDASWRNRVGAVLQESNAEPGLTVRETSSSTPATTSTRATSTRRSRSSGSRRRPTRSGRNCRAASGGGSTWRWR
jgi:ABC-type multidrug transport system ATPase subunit